MIATSLTCLSLFYVWQQTEIVRLAYACQKKTTTFQDALDKNSSLRYNLKKNTSLTYIGSSLYESCNFRMPENYCVVKVASVKPAAAAVARTQGRKEGFLARLFSVTRQAQAEPAGPPISFSSKDLRNAR